MNALERRAERIGAGRQRATIERIAEAMQDRLRSTQIEIGQDSIRVSGRGLVKRWMAESSLRFIADLAK